VVVETSDYTSLRSLFGFLCVNGRQRPLGFAALEDKIVQQAVVTILNQIYEEDFLGFSYGFRWRPSNPTT
jgi:retron-type reverse transcriptase